MENIEINIEELKVYRQKHKAANENAELVKTDSGWGSPLHRTSCVIQSVLTFLTPLSQTFIKQPIYIN